MAEGFVALASLVRGHRDGESPDARAARGDAAPPPAPVASSVPDEPDVPERPAFAHAALVGELALLRLAALEAYERASRRLLDALAAEVLGRELALAPVDCAAIARDLAARFADLDPVAVVVSPADAERVRVPLPLRIDASLGPGDLALDVADGVVECSFLVRLDGAVERVARA